MKTGKLLILQLALLWLTSPLLSAAESTPAPQSKLVFRNPELPVAQRVDDLISRLRQLVGFKRVSLKAGETKTVEIVVPVHLLRRWDDAQKGYVVDPGAYRLAVGPASDQPRLKAVLRIVSNQ